MLKWNRVIAAFLCLLVFNPLLALSIEVPVEAYGALPSKSLFAISPNAKLVAYRETSDNRDYLVVIDMAKGKIVKAAAIDNINPNQLYFVSDHVVVLVATKNVKIGGYRGRYDSSWAYAFNLETGKIHTLLEQDYGIYKGQTQLGRIVGLSKDRKYAYMPAYEDPGAFNLYRVDLEKRRKPRLHQKGKSDTQDFFVGEDGQVLARERFNNNDNLHRIEALQNDKWVEIYREETEIMTKGFHGLTPDRKSLVYSAYSSETGRRAYFTMSLSDGSISEPLFSREDKDVSHLLTSLQRVVHGAAYDGFTPTYEFFEEKLNARMRGLKKAMPNNSFAIRDYSDDWNNIIFLMQGDNSVGDYILYVDGGLQFMASSRSDIPPEAINPVIEQNIIARDKLVIPTLLTVPRGKKLENLPAIVLPHGGPASYDAKGFDYMAQFFANRGYIVIQPQFRGSAGFGLAFQQAGYGEWGRKMQDDITDSISSLVNEGKVDPSKICIVGASYGGYAALAGAAFTPDLYKCAVSINGVSDIERMMQSEKLDHGRDHWVIAYWQDIISNGKFDEDHLTKISPINHVKQIKAPILLIHGEYDEVVSVKQSQNMKDALESANKAVEFVELDNGDHYLSKKENRMQAMQAIAKFLKKHI